MSAAPPDQARLDGASASASAQRSWTVAARGAVVGAAFLALVLASPGMLSRDGSGWLAILALFLWALGASRTARRAFLVDAVLGALAWSAICSWAAYVWWGTLLWIGPGMGLYMALAGALLRRFARRMPLALAAPFAWLVVEGTRSVVALPFGFEWMRLGVHLHHWPAFGSALRALGLFGTGWIVASLGGWGADLALAVSSRRRGGARATIAQRAASWMTGLAPAGLALAMGVFASAPLLPESSLPEGSPDASREGSRMGPHVLLVQPGIAQARKMDAASWQDLLIAGLELTAQGLADARARGIEPDLVAWGETMLPLPILAPGLEQALAAGARIDPWWARAISSADMGYLREQLAQVEQALFGAGARPGLFAPGTTFVFGAEYLSVHAGRLRRQNAVFAWSGPGRMSEPAGKRFIVPGAETMLGLERFAGVRNAIESLAGYVPDLLSLSDQEQSRTLRVETRAGTFDLGVCVCFDNAFETPFLRAARGRGPDDPPLIHFVLSNEAWFRFSQEADQMLAFTRAAAAATALPVVRATNSGISTIVAPDGTVAAKLVVDGQDREVSGTLLAHVPLASGAPTPFVRLPAWSGWAALAGAWLWIALRGARAG